jgi:hypothetical protein
VGAFFLWLSSLIMGGGRMGEGDFIFLALVCFIGGGWIGGVLGVRLARRN